MEPLRLGRVTASVMSLVLVAIGASCAHEKSGRDAEPVGITTRQTTVTTVTSAELAPPPASVVAPPKTTPPAQPASTETSSTEPSMRRCIELLSKAPTFELGKSEIAPQDEPALEQIAACLTTGPLEGRSVELTGHADPRGASAYNWRLAATRANTVAARLHMLGVRDRQMTITSRGERDSTREGPTGWAEDRRVDIVLMSPHPPSDVRQ